MNAAPDVNVTASGRERRHVELKNGKKQESGYPNSYVITLFYAHVTSLKLHERDRVTSIWWDAFDVQ